jgi:hypothetical protein
LEPVVLKVDWAILAVPARVDHKDTQVRQEAVVLKVDWAILAVPAVPARVDHKDILVRQEPVVRWDIPVLQAV